MTTDKELEAVTRRAIKAWHVTEKKHRQALEIAVKTQRQMTELERIIRGAPQQHGVAA
jgi:hypothetical protein